MPTDKLIHRLTERDAVIGVVGLGYVGLPLLLRYRDIGYPVIGFDRDPRKIEHLSNNASYIKHIDVGSIAEDIASDRVRLCADFSLISDCDAIILCLPTPLDQHRQPDLSFITQSMQAIAPLMRDGQAIALESTTYPGTTDEVLTPILTANGYQPGDNVFVIYSPEREDPGNPQYSTSTIPKIISGVTDDCLAVAHALYEQVIDELVPVSSPSTAEMAKILENTYRAVNIALVNELKLLAERMGIDIFEVIRAAATKPFGFSAFYPGPGLGGHCIPIDPFYLTWKAREFEVATRFIELAGEVNTNMPDYVVDRVMLALNAHAKPVRGSRLLVLGAAYKKNVDDMRESPSVVIMEKLLALGAVVDYADPHVPVLPPMRKHSLDLHALEANAVTVANADCVVVCTDHDSFDWSMIEKTAGLIVDTRGRFTADNVRVFRA